MTHQPRRVLACPSWFDGALAGWLLGMPLVRVSGWTIEQAQAIWFCAGTMGLWAVSQWVRPQRVVALPGLGLLSILALLSSIAQSRTPLGGVVDLYFHLYVLLAGALFVVCGAWLVWLVATYATWSALSSLFCGLAVVNALLPNPGWLLTPSQSAFLSVLTIPLVVTTYWPLVLVPVWHVWHVASYSALAAVALTTLGGLLWSRRWAWSGLLTVGIAWVTWQRWEAITARLACRPACWLVSWREWLQSPWFGQGMDTSIQSPMISTSFGWLYRHQDFLALLRDYGLFAGMAVLWTLWQLWRRATWTQRWLLALLVCVMSVQTQAVFPRMMAFVCVIVGYCAIREHAT